MADNLCLMASHGYPHGLVLQQEQGMGIIKDFQPLLPSYGAKQEITKLGSLKLMPQQCEEPWKLASGLPEANWFAKTERPVLTDMQNVHPDSVLFSIGIAEHFIRREKLLQFLKSGETEAEKGGLDITVLYNLMGLHEMSQQAFIPSLIYPSSEFNTQKPLLDFVGGLAWSSKITVQPDGRVLFTGTGTEMEHLLSVVAEFYSLRNSVCWKKQSVLVPHFNREAGANIDGTFLKAQVTTLAPLKSPEKVKKKATKKQKSGKRVGKDRDLYKRNYFHACCGRVPFCASKLLNTGVAIGLVWLSWAVNNLRDTIIHISKNSKKLDLKEQEIMERVEGSVTDIYFRAATLMAVAVLRLA
ncbi:uncharacterized protein Pyn_08814 [Prunus yedoensis var. nudiflora]|uniref:Uncharacterized protein n=1 Tax=Prunus yedoensis var. nudiflora TaxID=2094558 RepID=A0A314ZBW3_PRUYE|nr:uncharacterized protein Pyn_08814 [Prunus yedoensis var. nudiflora]